MKKNQGWELIKLTWAKGSSDKCTSFLCSNNLQWLTLTSCSWTKCLTSWTCVHGELWRTWPLSCCRSRVSCPLSPFLPLGCPPPPEFPAHNTEINVTFQTIWCVLAPHHGRWKWPGTRRSQVVSSTLWLQGWMNPTVGLNTETNPSQLYIPSYSSSIFTCETQSVRQRVLKKEENANGVWHQEVSEVCSCVNMS